MRKPRMWTTEETEILLEQFNSDAKEKLFKRNKMDFCRDVAAYMNNQFIGRCYVGYVPLTAENIKSKLTVIRQQLEQLPNATDNSLASQGTSYISLLQKYYVRMRSVLCEDATSSRSN